MGLPSTPYDMCIHMPLLCSRGTDEHLRGEGACSTPNALAFRPEHSQFQHHPAPVETRTGTRESTSTAHRTPSEAQFQINLELFGKPSPALLPMFLQLVQLLLVCGVLQANLAIINARAGKLVLLLLPAKAGCACRACTHIRSTLLPANPQSMSAVDCTIVDAGMAQAAGILHPVQSRFATVPPTNNINNTRQTPSPCLRAQPAAAHSKQHR